MTIIKANEFQGPNQGISGGYVPHTDILSAAVDADFEKVLIDLDYHLSLIQAAFNKLDLLDPADLNTLTATEILDALNGSGQKIPVANLDDLVITESELASAIDTHKSTTNIADMHPESAIKSTELAYSYTPTSVITSCVNLLDELKNIRYQLNRVVGKTNWVDTPDSSIAELTSSLTTDISNLNTHISNALVHLSTSQKAAMDAAHTPSSNNPFATISDLAAKGAGDMLKATYDQNGDNIVDKAAGLTDGASVKSYADIVNKIASDISAHASSTGVSQYTDAMARGAVHSDSNHCILTTHDYNRLINKPAAIPAASLTSTEINNLKTSKLATGTTPWSGKADLVSGYIPASQIYDIKVLGNAWDETVISRRYYSRTTGSVSDNITGPAIIYGGMGFATRDYGYIQIGVNSANFVTCWVSSDICAGPRMDMNFVTGNASVWICPATYVPSGKTFNIVAGATVSGTSDTFQGAGYYITYKQL